MKLKLIVISCLLSIFPLMLFQIYYYYSTEKIVNENKLSTQNLEVRNSLNELSDKYVTAKQTLDLISQLSLPKVSLEFNRPEALSDFLQKTIEDSSFKSLAIINENKEIFASVGAPLTYNYSNALSRDLFLHALDGNIFEVGITARILSESNSVAGYIVAILKPEIFHTITQKLENRLNLPRESAFFFNEETVKSSTCPKEVSTVISDLKLCLRYTPLKVSFIEKNIVFIMVVLFVSALIYAVLYSVLFAQIFNPLKDLLESFYTDDSESSALSISGDSFPELKALQLLRNDVLKKIQLFQTREIEQTRSDAIAKVATQAVHDIRSPLLALQSLKDDMYILPENVKNQLRLSILRIEEITFNLLRIHRNENNNSFNFENFDTHILPAVRSILLEKQFEYRKYEGVKIVDNSSSFTYGLFSSINSSIFKRIISNLVNNAFESIVGGKGEITLEVVEKESKVIISVSDTGKGIPRELSDVIFNEDFTTKKEGNGLGLSMAKKEIEKCDGKIYFDSQENVGTKFFIELPSAKPPSYFVPEVDLSRYKRVIILEDDPVFFQIWTKKFEQLSFELTHYSTVSSLFKDISSLNIETLLLTDYDLMDNEFNGLDVIKKLNHSEHSILVTALSEEQSIQKSCLRSNVKLLPKTLVEDIPVKAPAFRCKRKDLILIDDDLLICMGWENFCKKHDIVFNYFSSVNDFLNRREFLSSESVVLLDSSLGESIPGEARADEIFKLGFKNIYLMTGYDMNLSEMPKTIKDILPKDFAKTSELILKILLSN